MNRTRVRQGLMVSALLGAALVFVARWDASAPPTPDSRTAALPPEDAPHPVYPERKASRPYRIAFVPKFKLFGETGRLSSYWQPAWEGARQGGEELGVQVRLCTSDVRGATDADYVEPQIRLVLDLIARGHLDGLILAPFDSNRLAPVVEKAVAAGIPIVALDTPVNSDRVLTFVSFDNYSAGKAMGAWVAHRLGGRGKALILDGPQDQQNAVDRRRGLLMGLQSGNLDILATASGDWETAPPAG